MFIMSMHNRQTLLTCVQRQYGQEVQEKHVHTQILRDARRLFMLYIFSHTHSL